MSREEYEAAVEHYFQHVFRARQTRLLGLLYVLRNNMLTDYTFSKSIWDRVLTMWYGVTGQAAKANALRALDRGKPFYIREQLMLIEIAMNETKQSMAEMEKHIQRLKEYTKASHDSRGTQES